MREAKPFGPPIELSGRWRAGGDNPRIEPFFQDPCRADPFILALIGTAKLSH